MSVRCILAVESSCDETALALISENGAILKQELATQIELHRQYGGVVPEVASRMHFDVVSELGTRIMNFAREQKLQIVKIAATLGPGLVGPLLVGGSYAQGLASGLEIPFVGVHHLRGHLASVLLELGSENAGDLKAKAAQIFPALVLLVSGGHTQVLEVDSQLRAQKILDTRDDAAGECFDKSAKLMGLPYPGGPEIEKLAAKIDGPLLASARALSRDLPRPKDKDGNFSFSGLKTAIRLKLEGDASLSATPLFAWAIEDAICDSLVRGLRRALESATKAVPRSLVVCGGVSANRKIRTQLEQLALERGLKLHVPPISYCTDNAAMIGAAAWVQAPESALTEVKARIPL